MGEDVAGAVEAVWRIERARLLGGLARFTGDLARAEDLAQEALAAALAHWPRTGIPRNPGAWLMAAARRRGIDEARHARMRGRREAGIAAAAEIADAGAADRIAARLDDDIGDELLALIFTACHPVLSPEARVALTLRLVAGLSTLEIARAFLTSEATVAQRITRAKAAIARSGAGFEVPRGAGRDARLGSVLEVVYLLFNEGYAATRGEDPVRPALCLEAQRLARILAGLMPDEPEVLGLLALLELQASRLAARRAPDGMPVPLTAQDRSRWDRLLIARGLAALDRAEALGGAGGAHVLQAAIAACHARAPDAASTDWVAIAALYDRLLGVLDTPVVALNRAVAHAMAFGAARGLSLLAPLAGPLDGFAPYHAARGDFLARAGRNAEAAQAFRRAAGLSANGAERAFLLARAAGP
ncbi:MAG: sigma-70 family RNA polymerase sigma factor [Rhodobacteraceae bacterium]|nr:sigma-70 family RNA polymerase sigma factor [Paracoccaceae bacterium]